MLKMPKKLRTNTVKIMSKIQPKVAETVLEIDLSALAHNYKIIRQQLDPEVKFMGVIKAYAYGSDSVAIANKLVTLGADYLAVAYINEGVRLRKAGIKVPILVFHPQAINFNLLITHKLEPSIYSLRILDEFLNFAAKEKLKDYPVHLKFNTGMNRLGMEAKETGAVLEKVLKTPTIQIESVFSHLAASSDWQERDFTLQQIHTFRIIAGKLLEKLPYQPLVHICNTSAIFNYPKAVFSMVRSGIGLYGFGNDKNIDKQLKPMGTLKSIISQIRELKKGDTLGYNRAFKAKKTTKIGILPLGYADGIYREYGNGNAKVLIKGEYAPIVGDVCMDMIMIDITNIACKERDEVIIFGGPQHTVKFAEAGNTISYELITGISQRVTRKIIL